MKKIKKVFKSNVLFIVYFPLILNYLVNFLSNESYKEFFLLDNYIKFLSFLLGSIFLYLLTISIMKSLKLNSFSLSLAYFLLSFFIIDNIFLPITKLVQFKSTFIIVSIFWILLIYKQSKNLKNLIKAGLSYLLWRAYNLLFFSKIGDLTYYQELNTDVTVQWFEIAKMIYENNYFYALENNLIEGQGLLPSYIQSLFLGLGFYPIDFVFIQTSSNLLFFLGILLIFDLKINIRNKYILSIVLMIFVLNNEWLKYLLVDSLMTEGIVSLLIAIFLVNFKDNYEYVNWQSGVFFLGFGSLVLTKNFISLLVMILIFVSLLKVKKNIFIICGLIMHTFNYIYQKIYFSQFQNFAYTSEIDFKDLLFDLIFLRDLKFTNVFNIINQILIDRPTAYLLTVFIISNFITFAIYKRYKFSEIFIFIFVISNYFLVNILYISYWQNIEYESSYRYVINCFHLIFVSVGIQLSSFEKSV